MNRIAKKFTALLLAFLTLFSSVTPALAAITYTYDANGNMASDGTKCFVYNDANQLKQVKTCSNNQLIAEYLYDHAGKRIIEKEYENGTLKHTIYASDKEFEKKKLANGNIENTTYYVANDEVVAKKNPDGSKNYYHNDHLGSTATLTDQSGALLEETTYYPYGDIRVGGTKSDLLFTGQEKDATGLHYYGARYYDTHIQRFTQPDTMLPDPYDPQQLNRYAYVRNNPLKYTDPSGNFIFIPAALYVGAVALSTWATAVTMSPDFQIDAKDWSDSLTYAQDPNNGNNRFLPLLAAGVTTALPGLSGGGGLVKGALKNGGDKVVNNVASSVVKTAVKIHKNSKDTPATTVLYTLRSLANDAIFKIGQTANAGRYSQKWLDANDLYMQVEAFGKKADILALERDLLKEFQKTLKLSFLGVFEKNPDPKKLLPYLNQTTH